MHFGVPVVPDENITKSGAANGTRANGTLGAVERSASVNGTTLSRPVTDGLTASSRVYSKYVDFSVGSFARTSASRGSVSNHFPL